MNPIRHHRCTSCRVQQLDSILPDDFAFWVCMDQACKTHLLTIYRLSIKKCHCTCSSSWQLFASSFSPLISTAKHTGLHEPQCCTGVWKLIPEVWANPLRSRKQSGSMWHSEGGHQTQPLRAPCCPCFTSLPCMERIFHSQHR